jgi:hypothetical protein
LPPARFFCSDSVAWLRPLATRPVSGGHLREADIAAGRYVELAVPDEVRAHIRNRAARRIGAAE